MDFNEEAVKTVEGRLDIIRKGIVREEKSVNYYKTLFKKIPEDFKEKIGIFQMYTDLIEEEKQHVERFHKLILQWEKIKELSE